MSWDQVFLEFLKLYGPLSLGWVVAAYLGVFILKRYDVDIQSKVQLAIALDKLAESVESRKALFDRIENALNRGPQ